MEDGAPELAEVLDQWRRSADELGECLQVSGATVTNWLRSGVPAERRRQVADLWRATVALAGRAGPGGVAAAVRRRDTHLGGFSLLEVARTGDTSLVARHTVT